MAPTTKTYVAQFGYRAFDKDWEPGEKHSTSDPAEQKRFEGFWVQRGDGQDYLFRDEAAIAAEAAAASTPAKAEGDGKTEGEAGKKETKKGGAEGGKGKGE